MLMMISPIHIQSEHDFVQNRELKSVLLCLILLYLIGYYQNTILYVSTTSFQKDYKFVKKYVLGNTLWRGNFH